MNIEKLVYKNICNYRYKTKSAKINKYNLLLIVITKHVKTNTSLPHSESKSEIIYTLLHKLFFIILSL